MHFGFGLALHTGVDGIVVRLLIENEGFYPMLSNHLIPPIVEAGFWSRVRKLKESGTDFFLKVSKLNERITEDSQDETSLATVMSWRHEPNVGITSEFGTMIFKSALKLEQCMSYAYFELAIVYLESGTIITQVGEGIRLLQGAGIDPALTSTYVSTAGAWVIPQGNQRLICDKAIGMTELVVRAVHFILKLHAHVIAIGSLEQIRHCREVHQKLIQKYAKSTEAKTILLLHGNLAIAAKGISAQLKQASLHLQFPGRCPFCPLASVNLA